MDLTDTVLCLHNEGSLELDDRAYDCSRLAVWHLAYEGREQTQCCDEHLGQATAWRPVEAMHEFMAACNLPGSWYLLDQGCCVTEDRLATARGRRV